MKILPVTTPPSPPLPPMVKAARWYAQRLGWSVLPIRAQDKKPLLKQWPEKASRKRKNIYRWWRRWPNAGIGIATGKASGVIALDVDVGKGGEESLYALSNRHGPLPSTVEFRTRGGGRHILFKYRGCEIQNSVSELGPGLDIRGDRGYIVVPPSVHRSGCTYEWEASSRPDEIELAPLPQWLLKLLIKSDGAKGVNGADSKIPEGVRNVKLTSLAGNMWRCGLSAPAMEAALLAENAERCKPPLAQNEVQGIARSIASYPRAPGNTPVPQPLPDNLPAVRAFDPQLLPEVLRPSVEDIAERMQCPPDFPAVAAMIGVSAVIGRQCGIRPKRHDTWAEVPNCWGAIVGRPGVLKTPAIQEAIRPINRFEIAAREAYEREHEAWKANQLVVKEQKKVTAEQIRIALKTKKPDAQALALSAVQVKGEEPTRQRMIVNDATVEKLGEILNENPRGVLVFRDELTGFLKSLDREGHQNDRAFYLEAWNGTGSYCYDRIGRGTLDIEAACVSILGSIQPGPLVHYLSAMRRGGAADDGLMQRFQLLVWPDISGEWKDVDRWPETEHKKRAHEAFARLNQLEKIIGAQRDDDSMIPFLRFSAGAQELFSEWRAKLERRLRAGNESPAIEAHLAKYRGLIPSLALCIHLVDVGHGPVSIDALKRACAWGTYLESHARRVYSPAIAHNMLAARALARHIQASDLPDKFSLREVYRHGWTHLADKDSAAEAVTVLEDFDWLIRRVEATGGRRRTSYEVVPGVNDIKL